MTTKLLKGALTRIAATAIAAVFFTPTASAVVSGGDIVNPVTGETESYENIFTGETAEWNDAANWDTSTTPFITTTYSPALVNGAKTVSTSTAIDGWTLRVGAYNGAAVTWSGGITKIQADNTESVGCWLTADETSSITIASFAGKQLEGSDSTPFKLSSAKAGGITWSTGLTAASNTTLPFWYYLKGAGTVVYGGDITVANAQVIKQADITLSGTTQIAYKPLVTFGSGTTKNFTADATIKRLNSSGTDLGNDARITTVTTGYTTTLTTADPVGTCQLVQTSTGIDLYWVDGDPANVPAAVATVYKPSININFTSGAANGLTTTADVGLGEYAIPGTSWNNLVANNNGSLSALTSVADSAGTTWTTAASVTISGTRGSYSCSSLTAASDLRHGYIDENGNNPTPTITVSGIPYDKYRVVVYTATDTPATSFGYITINGKNYTYDGGALTEDTTAWGASGAQDSAEPMAEGVNVLVSPVILGSTLTVVGHRGEGARGCIAAIQIVEVVPEITENDLVINVYNDTTNTVNEAKTLSGTVYVVGSGTLTLNGTAKISAATIDVGPNVTMNVNADRLDGTTFVGAGTVVFDGVKPTANKGWTDDSSWLGTIWVKNIPTTSNERKDWALQNYGNANSTLRFTDVNLYFPSGTTTAFPGTIDIDGAGMNVCDGYASSIATIARLTGSGTLSTTGGSASGNGLTINDASAFTGTIALTKYKVIIGTATGTSASGVLQVESGKSITVSSATAPGGFIVNGTLVANGTLASSAATAVSGSGTVVFTSRLPSPVDGENETKWWKNANWTGAVQIREVTNLVGMNNVSGTYIDFNQYGHADSIVELNNVTGWVNPGYTCTPKFKVTGTLYLNNGYSNKANAFKVGTLLGTGTISGDGSAGQVVFNVTTDWSGFTGTIGLNNKCVVFGETIPDTITAGQIYISEGAVVTPQQTSGTWWAVGGIKVDGELRAPNLDKFGGGTTITTTDNGVFTLTDSNNTQDQAIDYARITGTGTLRYADVSGKWRTLSRVNFPTGMICENNLSEGLILQASGAEHVIGSLAGSGSMRSDWGGSYNVGDRSLKILQAKDTTYSGVFHSDDRITTVTVAPGASSSGTLTLSNTQTVSNDLTVESGAKVNLTGTWVGATTVAGTFGGTGTLTGNLTLTDGATIKVNDISDPLEVSGSLTATGAITIELPEGAGKGMVITTGSKPDISGATFTTMVGGVERKLKVTATANGLKFGAQSLLIRIR